MITKTSNDKKSVQEQANFWITRLDKGMSSAEKQQLIAWLNQDKAHYCALRRMTTLWGDISTQYDLQGIFEAPSDKNSRRDYIMKGSLAASIFAIAMLTVNLVSEIDKLWQSPNNSHSQPLAYQTFKTLFGQQKQITLTDGSAVTLNTNTVIEVAYSKLQRKITLIRGEAKFDVAKDKNRPFSVISGGKSFTALGTIYNVQRYNDSDMELLVEEGKVLVSDVNTPRATLLKTITSSNLDSLTNKEKNNIVAAGKKIAIHQHNIKQVQTLSASEIEKDLAWQQGMLIFNGEPLTQVLAEIQRYNAVNFAPIADDNMANIKVSGYFKTDDINGLLQSLNYNFAISYHKLNSNTFVLSRS